MANLKLTLDDFDSNDFELIAIHTTLKDFKLTFLINANLNLLLSKNENDITIKSNDGIGKFSRFCFEDDKQDLTWDLIKNKTNFYSNNSNIGFFVEDTITMNLIPELKTTDFLLKIDNVDFSFNSQEIINKISKIKDVSTVYKVETDKIKSINNLIF
ncbi:IPExxxVDY family protein [Flavobacterium urocaniciphilum]|uniref:IPExxxVDY family protein n=1 Tax=Flavobacterium urocaniciphilum TaxID=1299341 RepID=A0A1H9BJY2_9FLAO|nr:IPExxxVDY family protein [Flavobacterium urocaniciphilum]SEP89037.1 hypothetical protein SAMN05444005_10351 [Flavobacterium urocaniciphilum]